MNFGYYGTIDLYFVRYQLPTFRSVHHEFDVPVEYPRMSRCDNSIVFIRFSKMLLN